MMHRIFAEGLFENRSDVYLAIGLLVGWILGLAGLSAFGYVLWRERRKK